MQGIKTTLNTIWGIVVTWFTTTNMHQISEAIGIVVGILTATYLVFQIMKSYRMMKTYKRK